MGAPDGFAEQVRHRECFNFAAALCLRPKRNGIGDDEFFERRFLAASERRSRQDGVSATAEDLFCALCFITTPPALCRAPAVSIISSTRIATWSATSPIMFISATTFGPPRRL